MQIEIEQKVVGDKVFVTYEDDETGEREVNWYYRDAPPIMIFTNVKEFLEEKQHDGNGDQL